VSASALREALAALYARVPLGMRLGLEPMREACTRAGHPEAAFEAVHIGGTNGKGSTAAMIASSCPPYRTGLYTSPHLCRFAERIQIDGVPLDDVSLSEVLREALTIGPDLSFFETATLAAFLAFRQAKVDKAVIEVGIGGRLDATNVIPPPRCAAITNVALDHQDRLGDSLEAIAREKAAIAKPGVPVVLGPMPVEAERAAREVIAARGGTVLQLVEPPDIELGLEGPHQRSNARVAWTVLEPFGIRPPAGIRGLCTARWPGRLERIEVAAGPLAGTWILDGAHNPDGMQALVNALSGEVLGAVVFGALEDKAWRPMLHTLARLDAPRVYVSPSGRSPASPAALATLAPGEIAEDLGGALASARRRAEGRPVVVCGSLYLVGAARARLLGLPSDPIVAL
jgi:dihydrofolate synthase / folylpolyglutamate synthase